MNANRRNVLKQTLLFLAVLLLPAAGLLAAAQNTRVLTVSKQPRQQMAYGMDFERLWSWKGLNEKQKLAEVAVRDCRVDLGAKLDKPVWNTELHGWRGNDEAAVANTAVLFQQIRSGVGALNDWLSLGNEKKDYKMFRTMDDGSLEVMRIYYIFQQLVNTSSGGRYVPTSVPDGLTSSAAFLRGDLMTVWLLNGADRPVPAVKVDLGPRTIADGAVKTVRWGPDNGREGTIGEATPITKNALVADVAAQTLLCFEFKVK